ncbi:MAG: trypsin-like peptidase domain-containing protein [Flavobacteriaceae bacterium]|nr:trypsin-like peptidase domain-containing protein [Flavobacteriaceae bacterium]
MKKNASFLLMAILGGAISLGAYTLLVGNQKTVVHVKERIPTLVTSSGTPTNNTNMDFTLAAQKTIHSVVHVKNLSISKGPTSAIDFFYGYGGTERQQIGTGSGVIISPDGYIVTNNHVIAEATQLQVTLNNNKTYEATLIGSDRKTDIALLKIDAEQNLPALTFGDSDASKIGEWVLAVGNPFNLTSTVTAGIISAKARDLGNNQSFIQTDAAVNPGNSGGALVNSAGDLIGINTAISSRTGSYVGYSFAVPSNIAKKIIDDLLEFGSVQKGIIGIQGVGLNSTTAEKLEVSETQGVYIGNIVSESGAEEAGLQEGDIIKKIDQVKVNKFPDLIGYIHSKRPGDKVNVVYTRNGKEKQTLVTLKKNETFNLEKIGLSVKALSKKDQKKYNIDYGVKITGQSQRYQESFEGKILLEINGSKIRTPEDAQELQEEFKRYLRPSILILNQNGEKERIRFY